MIKNNLKNFLKKQKIDGIYVTNKANIEYICNFTGSKGILLITKKRNFLLTDFRYYILAKKILPKFISFVDITDDFEKVLRNLIKRLKIKKLGIEANHISHSGFLKLKKILKKTKFIDKDEALCELRIQKTHDEIEKIKHAQRIADHIFAVLKKTLKAGQSEKEIAWRIQVLAHKFKADGVSFEPIVAINQNSACAHHKNTDKKLKKDDLILIDMGVKYKSYCSDMTRVLFARKPTAFEQKIYSIVLEAQEAAIKKLTAGATTARVITASEVDRASRDLIEKHGYLKYFGHHLGHGIGLEIHELPNLSKDYKKPLLPFSIFTIEPGIYLEGRFGIRIEDMIYLKDSKIENLTKTSKSIQDMIIRL